MTVLIILAWLCIASATLCTKECDLEFLISPTVEICGTDYETHKAPLTAILGLPPPWSCYRSCGVSVLYPGVCGCPNGCGEVSSRGKCENSTCACQAGWGGEDCNSVVCPNTCSNNGKCVSDSGLDLCKCHHNFTGPDCSIPILHLPVLPYGEILPNSSYYVKDKYGDNHPIFNLSVIANWNIEMDKNDYEIMLQPANTWNQSRADVKVYFSNGNIHEKVHKASMKLKGHFARLGVKKSFSLRFKEKFYEVEDLVLKAPSLDVTYLRNLVTVEYLRAMMVPAARGSFATLTINGKFWGLFWMKEEIDKNFIHSRYGNSKGNFYALSSYLDYYGEDPEAYKNCAKSKLGDFPCYKEEFGNGTWLDLVSFAKFINSTMDEEFHLQVGQVVDVDSFVRTMVVISAIDDPDSFTQNGNNWALYNNPANHLWEFISKDFEETMFNPLKNAYDSVANNQKALLAYRIMNMPTYHDMFNKYYAVFLNRVFNPEAPNSAIQRINALLPFLENIIDKDEYFRITYGLPVGTFAWKAALKELNLFLDTRYYFLRKQFDMK